jgi:hypothetical protein
MEKESHSTKFAVVQLWFMMPLENEKQFHFREQKIRSKV